MKDKGHDMFELGRKTGREEVIDEILNILGIRDLIQKEVDIGVGSHEKSGWHEEKKNGTR